MSELDYSLLGSGKIYLRKRGAAEGLLPIGNCSALGIAVEEDEKKLLDYTKPGGGTRNSVKRVTAVTANITAHDVSGENLARFGYGTKASITAAAVSGESAVGYKEAFVPFANLANDTIAPTVAAGSAAVARANTTAYDLDDLLVPAVANGFYYKVTTAGTTGGAPPTFPTVPGDTVTDGTAVLTCMGKTALVANTDYEVRPGGIFILAGASFTNGETLTLGYTKAAATVAQLLTAAGQEYELVFAGLNEARSGKKTLVTMHRVKPGFLQQLSLIGEDYAAMEVTAELLADTTKGAGLSQYCVIAIEE